MQRYHETFWVRGPKTFTAGKHSWQKLQARVERGEAILKESAQACAALAVHVARSIPSYAAPPHLLQPGASRASLAALPTPTVDALSSMLESGVPFATNPWQYIPLSYSTAANPWGHAFAASASPPPKYMTVGLAKGVRCVGDAIVSPFSSLAPVALPSIAWATPPLPLSTKALAQTMPASAPPTAPASAEAAPLTLTAILSPGLEAAAAHSPHRLLTEHAALSFSRAGYVASNDAFLLSAIARYGGVSVCSFDAIADDIRRDPAHMLDTFFRSRSPAQLEARAKVLLKCVLRDVVDAQRRPDKALADEAKQAQKRLTSTYARIADEMAAILPDARVIVATSDTLNSPDKAAQFVELVSGGGVDVIVGTQLVTKGFHFPDLTLVGVIDADLGLEGGDLRAGERTYQQIAQVSGRAGRAEKPGEVLIQTRHPRAAVIAALASGDRDSFYGAETAMRRDAGAPPFGRWAAIIVSAPDETEARDAARSIGTLRPHLPDVMILGPAPAPMTLLRGRYRYRLLINARRSAQLQDIIRGWLGPLRFPAAVRVAVDIDPYSFV